MLNGMLFVLRCSNPTALFREITTAQPLLEIVVGNVVTATHGGSRLFLHGREVYRRGKSRSEKALRVVRNRLGRFLSPLRGVEPHRTREFSRLLLFQARIQDGFPQAQHTPSSVQPRWGNRARSTRRCLLLTAHGETIREGRVPWRSRVAALNCPRSVSSRV